MPSYDGCLSLIWVRRPIEDRPTVEDELLRELESRRFHNRAQALAEINGPDESQIANALTLRRTLRGSQLLLNLIRASLCQLTTNALIRPPWRRQNRRWPSKKREIIHDSEHAPLKETIGLDPGRGAPPARL